MTRLGIDPSDNPEFNDVFEGLNSIMSDWNRINRQIHARPVLGFFTWVGKQRRELGELGKELQNLQKNFLEQQTKAWNFALNPRLKIPPDSDQPMTFYLYHSTLLAKIGQMRENMMLIVSNLNLKQAELTSKLSFQVAILSLFVGGIGLAISLLFAFA